MAGVRPGPEHAEGPISGPMLLDELLPSFDAARIEHRVVAGDLETTYEAVRRADFVRAWRENGAVRILFAARALGERVASALRRRSSPKPPEPETLRLADLEREGEFVLLGENPPSEIAFGMIGRIWAGETVWKRIHADEFTSFDRPGFGKIASSISLRPYGPERTLVSYETRTQATDGEARRGFMRYWRPLSPFIGIVLRAQLRVIEEETGQSRPWPRRPARPGPGTGSS